MSHYSKVALSNCDLAEDLEAARIDHLTSKCPHLGFSRDFDVLDILGVQAGAPEVVEIAQR